MSYETLNKALDRIAALEAELAEARLDSERLMYLISICNWTASQQARGIRAIIDAARGTR